MDAGILPKVPKNLDNKVVHGGAAQPQGAAQTTAADASPAFAPIPEFRMGYDALSMLMAAARNFAFIGGAPAEAPAVAGGASSSPQFNCYIYTTSFARLNCMS